MGDRLADLKRDYHGRLGLHGGVSVQNTLPRGTPEDVEDEVKKRVAAMAPGGGYILGTAHNVQADCPLENVDALMAAYRKHGRYWAT